MIIIRLREHGCIELEYNILSLSKQMDVAPPFFQSAEISINP
jgi:hypothetical protein